METQTHEASSDPQGNRDGLNTVHSSCILILENEILPRICLRLPGSGLAPDLLWGVVSPFLDVHYEKLEIQAVEVLSMGAMLSMSKMLGINTDSGKKDILALDN